jgi:hypothetical protein
MSRKTIDPLWELFEKYDDEFLKFDRIAPEDRRHVRPDLCAMLYLHERLGGNGDAIACAEHDEIWLEFDNLQRLTDEDAIYLHRCGIRYDPDNESLCLFV